MEKIENLKKNFIQKYSKNGTLQLGDVKKLYLNTKYTVIGSVIHSIYGPIAKEDLEELTKHYLSLPEDYICFLNQYNGLSLFSLSLCIYGFGLTKQNGVYLKSRDIEYDYPFNFGDYNVPGCSDFYIIGSFCDKKIIYKIHDKKYFLLAEDHESQFSWDSIESMINWMIDELNCHYNKEGKVDSPIILGKLLFNKAKFSFDHC